MKQLLLALALLVALVMPAAAAIKTEKVLYADGDVKLEGVVIYDDALPGPLPGVLVIHQWTGISPHEVGAGEKLASLGYVAFLADIYGQGVRPAFGDAAGAEAGKYKGDPSLYRRRLAAGLQALKARPNVDATRTAAIGYCFGGTGVLELARAGGDVRGVVSFHGGLATKAPATKGAIKAKVLVQHGADDGFVPPAEVAAFQEEMRQAGADWQFTAHGGAVHSFTDLKADGSMSPMVKYNADADRRSWAAMRTFLDEVLKGGPVSN